MISGNRRSVKELVADANTQIQTYSQEEALAMLGRDDVVFVDIRDIRELKRDGMLEGAMHAPRGMLEFWVDPSSPYFKDVFGEDKKFIFYCQSGWRSALATKAVQDMGMDNVSHIGEGFRGWNDSGAPTEAVEAKKR